VTGQEAIKATKRGDALEKNVEELTKKVNEEIEKNKNSMNLHHFNKEIYNLNDSINHSQISYWRKDKFRVELESLKKKLIDLEKGSKALLLTNALEECKDFVQNNPNIKKVIKEFKVGGEARSLNEILKYLRQHLAEASIMLFSIDDVNSKILCLSSVPDVSILRLKIDE
jgi:benzoyl-CoA reductase/2-hydroxyglutaryl-CoA dehydratase subunit BcrC/BadD/HgdB